MQSQDTQGEQVYDLAVLGGGTGGYVAAIRAAQLGLDVVLVEENKVGGTCLHQGCIPSKAYLRTAEMLVMTRKAAEFGIETSTPMLNWTKMVERKNAIVKTLFIGVQGLLKKNKVQVIQGRGSLNKEHDNWVISVADQRIPARQVILATGSRPSSMGLALDETMVMTSDQALERQSMPKSILIVGAGAIGLEFASLYRDCGAEVTVVESMSRVLPMEDEEISRELRRLLEKRGIRFHTESKVMVEGVQKLGNGVEVPIIHADGQEERLIAEALLVSVGRRPNVEQIGIEALNLQRSGPYVLVNGYQQTSQTGLYAIGDVCGGGLAHTAAMQGVLAVEHAAGLDPRPFDPHLIPKCTYTHPEVASIGFTEEAARQAGYDVKAGKYPFRALGKAIIQGEFEGFAKIVTEMNSGSILGVHVIGPHATELIAESGVLIANGMDIAQWAQSVHPHPSLSEIFHEAALAVEGRAIHF